MTTNTIKTRAGENYLLESEEKKLFAAIKSRKGPQAERDYVLVRLCRATGLRRSEALALNVGDVFGRECLEVDERIARKGSVGQVYIPKDMQDLLLRFMRLKKKWGESVDFAEPLFVSRKGKRLSPRAFNDLMDKWCAAAGIGKFSPHALRHTKGHRIMDDCRHLSPEEAAKKLLFAQKQLRHKSITSTAIYTAPTKEEMERVGDI